MAKSGVAVRLRALHEELTTTAPYPWSGVKAWIAKARPLFRTSLASHLPDFETATKEPPWTAGIYVSGEDMYGNRTDNTASEDARVERENRVIAHEARNQLLAYVEGLLTEVEDGKPSVPDAVDVVVSLFRRFDAVAKSLETRRKDRQPVVFADEYDVQYIVGALLVAYFDDVRPEDYVESVAGGASRVDFVLKKERIVVEIKVTSAKVRDREIGEQLIIDQRKYREHKDCGTLICFVYDPGRHISNATALESDLSQDAGPHTIVIVRR